MSEAIKLIVDGYTTLKNRTALEDLRAHRQRLLKQLQEQPKGWVDTSHVIEQFDQELRVIESGISKL
jgi:hypothetical protein